MGVFYNYYLAARKYYEEHGDLLVPDDYIVGDINLGMWIKRMRTSRHQLMLSDQEKKLLDDMGMIWNREDYNWDIVYNLAVEYFIENKNLLLTIDEVYKDYKLGRWLSRQRSAFNKEKLPLDRLKKLELISMPWDLKRSKDIEKMLSSIDSDGEKLDCFSCKFDYYILGSLINIVSSKRLKEEEIKDVIDTLKNNVNHQSYKLFLLFCSGVSIKKISEIFYFNEHKAEEVRLQVYQEFLEILKDKDFLKARRYVKRI